MSAGSFLTGVALVALAGLPVVIGAVFVRRRLLPEWTGVDALIADAVLVVGIVTVVGEVLGIAGVLERWSIVGACVATGAALFVLCREHPLHRREVTQQKPLMPRHAALLSGAGVLLVAWQWLATTIASLREGMQYTIDTLWYHGPMSARFVQEGSILGIQYFDDDPLTAFFPGGSALLHAMGIAVVGDDILSPLVNLAFLALVFLSAWSLGRALDAVPLAMLSAVVFLVAPTMTSTQPGGEYNDVVVLALALSAAALLVRAQGRDAGVVIAGAAAGLSIGVKFTMVPVIAAVTIGLIVAAGRGRRLRTTTAWVVPLAAISAVWYVRNLVVAGNPLPGLNFSLGPLSLPELPTVTPLETILVGLGDWDRVRDVYLPGLDQAFGPVWPMLVVGSVVAALVVVVRRGDPWIRAVALATPVGVLAFLVKPQYYPTFAYTLRYVVGPLMLGLLLAPAVPALRGARARQVVLGALALMVVVIEITGDELWAEGRDLAVAAAALAVVGAVVWCARALTSPSPRVVAAAATAAAVVAVGALYFAQRDYRANRATFAALGFAKRVLGPLRNVENARIATVGMYLQYPMYGRDLSNHVQYLGEEGDNGRFAPFRTCKAFMRAVNRGRYDYVLVARQSYPVGIPDARSRELRWARFERNLRLLGFDGDNAAVYAIDQPLDPGSCR